MIINRVPFGFRSIHFSLQRSLIIINLDMRKTDSINLECLKKQLAISSLYISSINSLNQWDHFSKLLIRFTHVLFILLIHLQKNASG